MAPRDPDQVWWQAADGHWYPPTSHPSHEWSGRPVHVRTGCGGLVGTTMLVVLVVTVLGSGHVGLLLLAIPLLIVLAVVSFLRMVGRSILAMSRISDEAWQEAHRHAQQRFAEQLRFFEAQQRQAQQRQAQQRQGQQRQAQQRQAQQGGARRQGGPDGWQRGPFQGGSTGGPGSSQGRPHPPGPSRDTSEWARSVLGVRPGATPVEIRHAFREASKRWHPDLFMQASAGERADAARHMEDVNAAHAILSGGSRRVA